MSSTPSLKAAILIVSTTASKDASQDTTIPILRSVFDEAGGQWEVVETKIVGDNVLDIQQVVMRWTDVEQLNLVITSGGTGFSLSDNTPEVSEKEELLFQRFFGIRLSNSR